MHLPILCQEFVTLPSQGRQCSHVVQSTSFSFLSSSYMHTVCYNGLTHAAVPLPGRGVWYHGSEPIRSALFLISLFSV